MKDLNDKYPWWDWSYFIQMQIDWLENAAKRHRNDGITSCHMEIADSLQEAANMLREATEAMESAITDEEAKQTEEKLLEAYKYIVENIRWWWDY